MAIALSLKEVALGLSPTRVLASGLGIVLCAMIVGCVYIPPIGEDDAGVDPASFEIGSTSRSDVLSILGSPVIDNGRFILDELETTDGGFLVAVQFSAGYFPIGVKKTRLLLEFNEENILDRVDIESATRVDIHGNAAPDKRPPHVLEPSGKMLPFKNISWWTGPPNFSAAAFSPNGNLLAASDSSNQIFLIDFDRQSMERISPEGFDPDGRVRSVTFSPDGRSLAVLSRTIRIIDLRTRTQTVVFDGHGNASVWVWRGAHAMAYAPSGEAIASVGSGGNVKIWETSSGREIASWAAHEKRAGAIAFSPDGAILATSGADGFVRLWDRNTGAEMGSVKSFGKPAFSDNGKLLAIASSIHAELWRLNREPSGTSRGQRLAVDGPADMIVFPYFYLQPHHRLNLWAVSPGFTPRGDWLLHSAGSTVIWDWTEGRKTSLATPIGDTFLAFSPDGQTMARSSADGVRLWKLPVVSSSDVQQ